MIGYDNKKYTNVCSLDRRFEQFNLAQMLMIVSLSLTTLRYSEHRSPNDYK